MFYDLGSGVGKAVIAAAILHNFDKCVGIEYLGSLHSLALSLKADYEDTKKLFFGGGNNNPSTKDPVQLIPSSEEENLFAEPVQEQQEANKSDDVLLKFPKIEFIQADLREVVLLIMALV